MRAPPSSRVRSVAALSVALYACAGTAPPASLPPRTESASSSSSTMDTGSVPPFNRHAAARALAAVDVSDCGRSGGPGGPGHVTIVMATDGGVASVRADSAPYEGTLVGTCIEEKFRGVRVPAFDGAPMTLGKQFRID